jgi:NAD(P)-dependent dehydrogenase (short-subunit alcohol dehydrogenase family)
MSDNGAGTSLEGRVALVTGSASGIGAASAAELAARGAKVAVADINDAGAGATVGAIEKRGGVAMAIHLDVSEEESWLAAMAEVDGAWGNLGVLHNNAAAIALQASGADVDIARGEVGVWDSALAVNLRGVMLGCKHAIPRMVAGGGGVIINTSSTSALWGGATAPAYAASKSGIVSVTQHVASRYGRDRIRCVAIAPGLIVTENSPAPQWFVQTLLRQQCLPQTGRPQDIANAVAFLASDDASFITGVLIPVDAGQTCHRPWLADELEHEDAVRASEGG